MRVLYTELEQIVIGLQTLATDLVANPRGKHSITQLEGYKEQCSGVFEKMKRLDDFSRALDAVLACALP